MTEKNGEIGDKLKETEPIEDIEEDNNPFPHDMGLARLIASQAFQLDEDDELVHLFGDSKVKNGQNETFKTVLMDGETRLTKMLKPENKVVITISDAANSNEGSANVSKKYIVYTIKIVGKTKGNSHDEILTRRRYSDFESLRETLVKIFPLLIIPPIPLKGSFNFKNLVSENDSSVSVKNIQHRKRLLSNFLNNCLALTPIRNLQFFTKFLDPNANWTDEINLISLQLPKNLFNSNPENGLKTNQLYQHLPNPTHSMSFLNGKKKVDKQKNASIIDTTSINCLNRRIWENFTGLSSDYADLGASLNSFSLMLVSNDIENDNTNNSNELNILFDKVGQIFDRSYLTINSLALDLEAKVLEPMGEAVQYTSTLHDIVKYQSRKQKQSSLLNDEIIEKKKELDHLKISNVDGTKIETAIKQQTKPTGKAFDLNNGTTPEPTNSATSNVSETSSRSKFKMFSLKKISKYVNEIIDQNPQQTRKQRSTSLIEKIGILEQCQAIMLEDLLYIADEISKNFSIFKSKQLREIFTILKTYNSFLIEWARKNVEIWEEIRDEIKKLD